MTTTLYHGEPNGPSLTVLAALFEKGADATLERIDLAAGERHGARVPHAMEVAHSIEGEGPVLVVDGTPMADSVFLAAISSSASPPPHPIWESRPARRRAFLKTSPVSISPSAGAMPRRGGSTMPGVPTAAARSSRRWTGSSQN